MRAFYSWGLATLLLLGLGVAYAQNLHTGHIADSGAVAEQHIHAKTNHTITWTRRTGAGKPWYIKFTGKSPCSNGSEFGSDRTATCNVNAVCKKANDPSCIYAYNSSLSAAGLMNDPDVIVDP